MPRIPMLIITVALTALLAISCGQQDDPPPEEAAPQQEIIWPTDTPEPETPGERATRAASARGSDQGSDQRPPQTVEPTDTPVPPRPEELIPTVTPLPTVTPPTTIAVIPLMIPTPTRARAEDPIPTITPRPRETATPLPRTTATPFPTRAPTPTVSPEMSQARVLASAARIKMVEGNYAGALELLTEAEELLGRRTPWIISLVADVRVGQGRDDEAADLYTNVIRLTGGDGEQLLKRARIRLRQDNIEAAEQDALAATQRDTERWQEFGGEHPYDSRAEAGRILTELYVISQDFRDAHRYANFVIVAAIAAEYPPPTIQDLKERRDWLQSILRAMEQRDPDEENSS